jgi:hypothetical protein
MTSGRGHGSSNAGPLSPSLGQGSAGSAMSRQDSSYPLSPSAGKGKGRRMAALEIAHLVEKRLALL